MSVHLTKSLLKRQKNPSNTALIIQSAVSSLENAEELVRLLFQYSEKQEINVTDKIV